MSGEWRGQIRSQTNESERKEDDGRGSEETNARGGTRVSCLRIFLVIFSVYLYCPLFIQCPSAYVCPSIFSFLLFPLARSLRVPAVAVVVIVVVVVFVAAVLLLFATNCTHLFVYASLSLLTPPSIYSKRCLRSR